MTARITYGTDPETAEEVSLAQQAAELEMSQVPRANQLARYQHAATRLQEEVDRGVLDPREAGQLGGMIQQRMRPLMVRASQLPIIRQQLAMRQAMQAAAMQESLMQQNAAFRARRLQDRIATFNHPITGEPVTMYETGPGEFTPLPAGMQAGLRRDRAGRVFEDEEQRERWIRDAEKAYKEEDPTRTGAPPVDYVTSFVNRRREIHRSLLPAEPDPATGPPMFGTISSGGTPEGRRTTESAPPPSPLTPAERTELANLLTRAGTRRMPLAQRAMVQQAATRMQQYVNARAIGATTAEMRAQAARDYDTLTALVNQPMPPEPPPPAATPAPPPRDSWGRPPAPRGWAPAFEDDEVGGIGSAGE
jgi:hypothetical protein